MLWESPLNRNMKTIFWAKRGGAKVEEKNWYLWIRENMSGEVMERKVGSNVKPFFVR